MEGPVPTYEYQCRSCEHRLEKVQGFNDEPLEECPECGGQLRRVIHPVGIIFKGSGWYCTDSRKSSVLPSESSSKESIAKEGTTKESTATEVSSTSTSGEKQALASSKDS
jgi:putative FmdB family regulatory protein